MTEQEVPKEARGARPSIPLSSDAPLEDPNDDLLGYKSFAEWLAKAVADMTPTEGLVLALYGPWGSGKSTVLNFVESNLSKRAEDSKPLVIRFNPWWFSGQEDLVRRFFEQLRSTFQRWSVLSGKARDALARLATLVSMIPSQAAWGAALAGKVVKGTPQDVVALKKSISEALRNQTRKIIIVLDDIDRLSSEEMREVFRLVKSVANFPNVIYLLSFDKDVAIRALEGVQAGPGEDFLKKIVQVPFDLPLPDRIALRNLLFSRLNAVIASTGEEYFDRRRWTRIFFDGVDHFIVTPRDAVRLANASAVTYPAVEGEVNATDFLALETIRVFCSTTFDIIRRNPEAFVGTVDDGSAGRASTDKAFHDSWLNEVPADDRDAVRALATSLFPKLEGIWSNIHYGADSTTSWRNQLRVCSPQVFPTYFRLTVPEGQISNAEMLASLATAGDPGAFAGTLLRYSDELRPDGTTRIRAFLDALEDYIPLVPAENLEPATRAILEVGDRLLRPEDYPRAFLDFGTEAQIGRVVYRLLCRIEDEDRRYSILREALDGPSLIVPVREISALEPKSEDGGSRRPMGDVSAEHLQSLQATAVEKLRRAAADGTLINNDQLLYLLYRWRDWAGPDEPREWVQTVTQNDVHLLSFLRGIFSRYTSSEGDTTRVGYRFDKKYLEDFLDVDAVRTRLDAMDRGRLSEGQLQAIDALLQAVEHPSGRWEGLESDLQE